MNSSQTVLLQVKHPAITCNSIGTDEFSSNAKILNIKVISEWKLVYSDLLVRMSVS